MKREQEQVDVKAPVDARRVHGMSALMSLGWVELNPLDGHVLHIGKWTKTFLRSTHLINIHDRFVIYLMSRDVKRVFREN